MNLLIKNSPYNQCSIDFIDFTKNVVHAGNNFAGGNIESSDAFAEAMHELMAKRAFREAFFGVLILKNTGGSREPTSVGTAAQVKETKTPVQWNLKFVKMSLPG